MVQHTAIVTMADQYKVVYDLSNDAIFNDLERPLPPVSRSRHSLTLNIFQKRYDIQSVIERNCRIATLPWGLMSDSYRGVFIG